MIHKKHNLQNQLKPYDYHDCLSSGSNQISSRLSQKPCHNPKLKVFELVGHYYTPMINIYNCFQEFNSKISNSSPVAMFKWPVDRWQSSPGNPNHRILLENTKRFRKNDQIRENRSQLRMTKSAIRVSNFYRTDER